MKNTKEFRETEIGLIPNDWYVVSLSEMLHLCQYGLSIKINRKGKFPIIKMDDIENGKVVSSKVKYVDIDEKTFNDFKLEKGDILFNRTNSQELVGRSGVFLLDGDYVFASYLIRLRTRKEKLYPIFLLFYMSYASDKLKQLASRAVHQANINATNLGKFKIPIPSIPEQKKIAEILTTVDNAIEKVNQAIEKTKRLKTGLMERLFSKGIGHREFKDTEIGRLPREWKITTIEEECFIGTGGTPSRNNPEYFNGNIPWVKSTEVDYNLITHTGESITELGLRNSNAKIYPPDSLIVALYGQGATRGKCAILAIEAAINQACAALQGKGRANLRYLFYWIQFSYSNIRNLSQGANQSNLNMGIIRLLKFPLPPLPEQKKIAEILTTVDKRLELLKQKKQSLEQVKKWMMDVLLTGKKRVEVP